MGGSSSPAGKIDFPDHMKKIHHDWLNKTDTFWMSPCMTTLMNNSINNPNPYTVSTAYAPDTELAAMIGAAGLVQSIVDALTGQISVSTAAFNIDRELYKINSISDTIANHTTITNIMNSLLAARNDIESFVTDLKNFGMLNDLDTIHSSFDPVVASVLYDGYHADVVTKYAEDTAVRLETSIFPRYNSGMRNIGAVNSSAYAVGRSLIEAEQDREVGKFSSELYMKNATDDALKLIASKLEFQKIVSENLIQLFGNTLTFKNFISDIDIKLYQTQMDAINRNVAINTDVIKTAIETQRVASTMTIESNRMKIVGKSEEMAAN